jgi:hypothetical protein
MALTPPAPNPVAMHTAVLPEPNYAPTNKRLRIRNDVPTQVQDMVDNRDLTCYLSLVGNR